MEIRNKYFSIQFHLPTWLFSGRLGLCCPRVKDRSISAFFWKAPTRLGWEELGSDSKLWEEEELAWNEELLWILKIHFPTLRAEGLFPFLTGLLICSLAFWFPAEWEGGLFLSGAVADWRGSGLWMSLLSREAMAPRSLSCAVPASSLPVCFSSASKYPSSSSRASNISNSFWRLLRIDAEKFDASFTIHFRR